MDDKKEEKTKKIKCDIDGIIAKKIKNLNGYGIQKATTALEQLYRLKKLKAPDIEIFDEMVEISRILKDYTSKTKGKQQQLLES